mmetsp:Transcript_13720/g.16625  ORF Transcript_13720/g.16625 Transcript_13720/m.16625 type:complete len:632 (+) Transcript_13720:102-1997(+)
MRPEEPKNQSDWKFQDVSSWTRRYQRNNKSNGLKNLRCFPYCSEVHALRGFCGRPISLRFERPKTEYPRPVFAWGEFRPLVPLPESTQPIVEEGYILTSTQIQPKVRTKNSPSLPWLAGEPVNGDDTRTKNIVEFTFNENPKGWHYGWVASKHTSHFEHVFSVIICEEVSPGLMKCVAVATSPSFTLFCRRRQRQNLADFPEQLRAQLEIQNELRKNSKEEFKAIGRLPSALLQSMYERKRRSECSESELSSSKPEDRPLKKRISKEKQDKIIWRIINALLLLDMYEEETYYRHDSEALQNSAGSSGLANTEAIFDKTALGERISSATEGGIGSSTFNLATGDNNRDPSPEQPAYSSKNLVAELARFLIEEESCTNEMEKIFSKASTEGCSNENVYGMLIDVFTAQIKVFLANQNATMEELQQLIPEEEAETLRQVDAKVRTQIDTYDATAGIEIEKKAQIHEALNMRIPVGTSCDISGRWKQDQESLETLEMVRAMVGVPWIQNKLFRRMEEKFTLFVDPTRRSLDIKYETKLLSDGIGQYILDNIERPFRIGMPIPHSESEGLMYRAYIHPSEDSIVLILDFRNNYRTIMRFYVAEDDKLWVILLLESRSDKSEPWLCKGEWKIRAERI